MNILLCAAAVAGLAGAVSGPAVAEAAVGSTPAVLRPARIDRGAVLRELTDRSVAGEDRRLGPDYRFYHKGQTEPFPTVYVAPRKQDPGGRPYEIGGPWTKEGGDFSSTQGQVLYVPDAGALGVDRVTVLEWSNGGFTESPEPPWWGGFRPEPVFKKWQAAAQHGKVGMPVGEARGMGGWSNCGVIVFSSGLVSSAGTVTGQGTNPTIQLPANKVPTAIAVTNRSEFALMPVYDTTARKGQVAVVALESAGKNIRFVHEWPEPNPGLANVAVFTGMKLLGFVDLPGIQFPTGITAVGNHFGGRVNGRDGNAGLLREYNLAVQADRDTFYKGNNADFTSTAGFAVVTAKYENRVAFIDLQPLFQRVREMYLTTEENYQKSRAQGPAPGQWPFTFDVDASWKPVVVKVMDAPRPTAVIASMAGGEKARALVASEDGTLGIYRVGGLATEAPALPEEIQRVGEVTIGHNPTCLAYQKYSNDTVIAVARGDREVEWIRYTGDTAQVIRRLRDQRMVDPVNVEQADTHGIETSLITVADFKGRQVLNYRYSPVVFATQGGARFGMGADGKDEFECGGVLSFPGYPFCISASNVN